MELWIMDYGFMELAVVIKNERFEVFKRSP